jgi:hypothetical protein
MEYQGCPDDATLGFTIDGHMHQYTANNELGNEGN